MVYSQICSWLDDYVGTDPPEELLDTWDFEEWLHGVELESLFSDCFIDTLKTQRARSDSLKIFYSLLWEYYLLRSEEALSKFKSIEQPLNMNGARDISGCTISTEDLAEIICGERTKLLQQKSISPVSHDTWHQTVYLTPKKGRLSESAWTCRFKPVVLDVYMLLKKTYVIRQWSPCKHNSLDRLATAVAGLSDSGRLICCAVVNSIDENVIPYNNYCVVQGSLEVLDGDLADYCECVIEAGFLDEGLYCGVVAVVGDAANIASWTYAYSPVYPNTKDGRRAARRWRPEQNVLERQHWTCLNVLCRPVIRNKRWWLAVGLPEYKRFWDDITVIQNGRRAPLFLDDV